MVFSWCPIHCNIIIINIIIIIIITIIIIINIIIIKPRKYGHWGEGGWGTESVSINGDSALSGLNLEKSKGFLFPGTKQTVYNN